MSSDQAAASPAPTPTMKDDDGNIKTVKCPRCGSPNTKFCYYNNYSLTQPRHFCKTCRRYWTKGGALRNVPIGGACRKKKKTKPSSKLFTGALSPPPMDSFPGLHHQYSMTAQFPSSSGSWPVLGGAMQEMNNKTSSSSGLACSIESLSCINQDLHWKLQQQRLAMLFGQNNNINSAATDDHQQQQQKRNLMMFQNSRNKEAGADVATECFFGTTGGGDHCNWNSGAGGQGWSPHHHHHVHQQNHHYTAFALHSDTN